MAERVKEMKNDDYKEVRQKKTATDVGQSVHTRWSY